MLTNMARFLNKDLNAERLESTNLHVELPGVLSG